MGISSILGPGEVTIETLFDDYAPTYSKEAFQESVIADLQAKGAHIIEILPTDGQSDLSIKVIDPFAAAGYNRFRSIAEYENWFSGGLPFPTKEDMEASLNGTGA